MYSIPARSHASTSLGLIGRDAPLIAISELQNFLNPPPVPEIPIVTRAELVARNSSATASLRGNTVLDPSTAITATSRGRAVSEDGVSPSTGDSSATAPASCCLHPARQS